MNTHYQSRLLFPFDALVGRLLQCCNYRAEITGQISVIARRKVFTFFRDFGRRTFVFLAGLLLACGFLTQNSHAALVITAQEIGGNVQFSWGGGGASVNLTGLTPGDVNTNSLTAFTPGGMFSEFINGGGGNVDVYSGAALSQFGTDMGFYFPAVSGSSLGWTRFTNQIFFPTGYMSFDTIDPGTLTVAGETFASLGMTTGLITVADWGDATADTMIQMNVVPEPQVFGVFIVLLAALLIFSWRRRRGTQMKASATSNVS